ncbi:MAG TPA: C40 family peptidase [Salinivirgaceae bacterium]|nr:C40 family peptidase [Salinivirgaceae bacterium]
MSDCKNNVTTFFTQPFFVLFTLLLLCSQATFGQRYIKKLDRWNNKQKYEKLSRRAPRLIKKNPNDTRIYYYAAYSEMKLSEKSSNREKGYKHLLNGIKFYNIFQAKVSETEIPAELKDGLHSLSKDYYKYFEDLENSSSIMVLDGILANTFNDTTESYRSSLASKKIKSEPSEDKLVKHKKKPAHKYREEVVSEAIKHKGKPYKYAANGPDRFDCSGFVQYVYLQATGYKLPHSASAQSKLGKDIQQNRVMPGDLIFFGNPATKNINHVGIIIETSGNEVSSVIHSTNSGITIDSSESASWKKHWQSIIVKFVTLEELIDL